VKPGGGGVVRTGRADHGDLLETELRLERAQGIDLAGNADHGDAGETPRARRLQQRQQGRIALAHAATRGHPGGLGDQHRHRAPGILGVRRHGQDGLNRTRLQQALGNARGDAGPLRALTRRRQSRPHHATKRAKEHFVRPRLITRATMHPRLQPGIIRLNELTGLATAFRIAAARNPTIRTQSPWHRLRKAHCPVHATVTLSLRQRWGWLLEASKAGLFLRWPFHATKPSRGTLGHIRPDPQRGRARPSLLSTTNAIATRCRRGGGRGCGRGRWGWCFPPRMWR
jgi:hypothetical protein